MTEEQINDAVMKAALLDWVMAALAGEKVCEFSESFVEVAAAQAARNTLESIARSRCCTGCHEAERWAANTLVLLGNYENRFVQHRGMTPGS